VLVDVDDDSVLLAGLRAGDELAFARLVDRHSRAMRRVALGYVRTPAVADDVVQEAWLGVVRGIDGFEGRSSLKTWIFRIVANVARTRAEREARTVPFSSLEAEAERDEPAVDPSRFNHPRYPGGWTAFPVPWALPEADALAAETRAVIAGAVERLPHAQRVVVTLRDIEGFSAEEACEVLEISDANQRVLLHRGRAKVRAAIERYVTGAAA
jgi:RNA polymerase sigma-70 factor (ECF subfamily)